MSQTFADEDLVASDFTQAMLEVEEAALVKMKVERAECVRRDKDEFEKALLAR